MQRTTLNNYRNILAIIIGSVIIALCYYAYSAYFKTYFPNFTNNNHQKLIAVIQTMDHPALDMTKSGIIDELSTCCHDDFQIVFESVHGDINLAHQVIHKIVAKKPAAIITIGTLASQIARKNSKSIPLIFSSVTDPVAAKLLSNLNAPEGNITGVSNFIDPAIQFIEFKKLFPNIENIGVVYNPGEINSVYMMQKMIKSSKEFDINIITVAASSTNEVMLATTNIIKKVDAIFINNDNTALSAIQSIVHIANKNKKPVFCSDVDTFDKGVYIVIGPDQYKIGIETAKMASDIVSGKKTILNSPVIFIKDIAIKINHNLEANLIK